MFVGNGRLLLAVPLERTDNITECQAGLIDARSLGQLFPLEAKPKNIRMSLKKGFFEIEVDIFSGLIALMAI